MFVSSPLFTKLSNRGGLGQTVEQEPNFQKEESQQLSTNLGFMADGQNGCLSSLRDTLKQFGSI